MKFSWISPALASLFLALASPSLAADPAITVTAPSLLMESSGSVNGTVTIPSPPALPLVVSLSSSDTSEATVPPSVTIAVGETTATFVVKAVEDTLQDGKQQVTISASAEGYTTGTAVTTVADNELHHLELTPVSSPQIRNAPITVSLTARSIDGEPIHFYPARATLTAISENGAISCTPSTSGSFSQGVWTGDVSVGAYGSAVQITATIGDVSTTTNLFTVVRGPMRRFDWSPISPEQGLDAPFDVAIRAVDAGGNLVEEFAESVELAALSQAARSPTNPGGSVSSDALLSGRNSARLQTYYTSSEVGGAGVLSCLAFNVMPFFSTNGPPPVMSNFTIRLKHRRGAGTTWEDDSWTIVFRQTVAPSTAGLFNCQFSEVFVYDGVSDLMVDLSYQNQNASSGNFNWGYEAAVHPRGIYWEDSSGDPLTWTEPTKFSRTLFYLPRLWFSAFTQPSPVRPAATAEFSAGTWSGSVSVPLPLSPGALQARVAAGHFGVSNPVVVQPARPPGIGPLYAEYFETPGPLLAVNPSPSALTTVPSGWSFTGNGFQRTLVTSGNGPHTGSAHLTMDSLSFSQDGRNEATWTVDLAGRRGVTLNFWAKGFSETPGVPPPSPFTTSANFDGVAISTNGTTWWEVQGLRPLPNTWTPYSVDLDSALAARGLAYNSTFKIRFNRYGNGQIPSRGIAIDDVEIFSASQPFELRVSAPAQVREGGSPVIGTITLPFAVKEDTVISLRSLAPAKIAVPSSVTIPAGDHSGYFVIQPQNDPLADGDKAVGITASHANFQASGVLLTVLDDDVPLANLTVPTTTISEGEGLLVCNISLNRVAAVPFTFTVTSSDPSAILVPLSTVTIQAGTSSANFGLAVVNDNKIDGPQSSTITVSGPNGYSQSITITVADDETLDLGLTPAADAPLTSVPEGSGLIHFAANLSGTLPTDTTLTLESSDPTRVTPVTPTVTISAGATSVPALFEVQNNDEAEQPVPVTLTVHAPGFTSASHTLTFLNNDPHHFTFAPIASPQVRGAPISIVVTARDANGDPVPGFNGTVAITAVGASIQPPVLDGFVNGVWTGTVQVLEFVNGTVLTVADAAAHTGSSNPFDVTLGTLHTYAWDPIPSPQSPGSQIPVTLRAVDSGGNRLPTVSDPLTVRALSPQPTAVIGPDWSGVNFLRSFRRSRTQVLFLASELGGPQTLAGFDLNLGSSTVTQVISNFVIRMKTTARTEFTTGSTWDSEGWTTVYRSSRKPVASGWMPFLFDVPFDYSGTENLLIDVSFNNGTFDPSSIEWRGGGSSGYQVLYNMGTPDGDPLTWTGTTGSPTRSASRPQTRFHQLHTTPAMFSAAPVLEAGLWSGSVTISGPLGRSYLEAVGASGRKVRSEGFAVSAATAPPATLPFTDGFELSTLANVWQVSSAGRGQAQILTTNGPQAGSRHVVLDSSSGTGRSELTLSLDLAGCSGVTLSFWAKRFSGSDQGPPPSPFLDGADFDGVAMSADGVHWYEIQSLRGMTNGVWTQFTVNLDAAITARGLAYGPKFFLRFNAHSSQPIPYDGFAIDTVSVTGTRGPRISLLAPASITENTAPLSGSVTLPSPAAVETTVMLASSSPAILSVPASVTLSPNQSSAAFPITAINNSLVTGPLNIRLAAQVGDWPESSRLVQVTDDDAFTAVLLVPAEVAEAAGRVPAALSISPSPSGVFTFHLASSLPTNVQVPSSVTFQPGQSVAPFFLTIVSDSDITGSRTALITAKLNNSLMATASLLVKDDEPLTLAFSSTGASVLEASTGSITLFAGGSVTTGQIVNLSSSDPSRLTVPATVTIPAGSSTVSVPLTAVDNSVADGPRSVEIYATASGFTNATGKVVIRDNEVHQFSFAPITGPKIRAVPFSAKISALNANGDLISNYTGSLTLSATGDAGAISIAPTTVNMANGTWTGNITVNTFSSNVRLTASDAAGTAGISQSFDVSAGPPTHYAWSAIPSPQVAGEPFIATITALDAVGNVADGHSGYLTLKAGPFERTIGTSSFGTNHPVAAASHDQRTQVIYQAGELGGSGTFTSLAMFFSASPSILSQWTIRMKHTSLESYSSTLWESTDWTTVYSGDVTPGIGWTAFNFTTPFVYNGTSNLLVDFSFNNAAPGISGSVRAYTAATPRALHFVSNSLHGDPLSWTGNSPFGTTSTSLPHLKLGTPMPTTGVTPETVFLTNGLWTGPLRVPHSSTSLTLTAADGLEGTGQSNSFVVNAPADADNDGLPDAWENAHLLAAGNATGEDGPLGDPDRDGIPNLIELAFDMDPRLSGHFGLPAGEAKTHPADGQQYLELTYRRRLGASWLDYVVETSSDCISWSSNPAAYEQIRSIPLGPAAQTEAVTIRILPAIGSPATPARFARIRVVLP